MRINHLLLTATIAATHAATGLAGEVEWINGPSGQQPNGVSHSATVSADGRYVAFTSRATNLIPNDLNGVSQDVFLKDRQTGAVTLISRDSAGVQSTWDSFAPIISADGRYIAFECWGALHPLAQVGQAPSNVYVHEVQTGVTDLVNVGMNGTIANGAAVHPSISADGRYVAFASSASNLIPNDANGSLQDVFLRDMVMGTTVRVSEASLGGSANSWSVVPSVSADGNYVSFMSEASDLVPNDVNAKRDVFRWERATGIIERASVATTGGEANAPCCSSYLGSISGDGRYVTFSSSATTLVPGDTNGVEDVFLRDILAGVTTRVTPNSSNSASGWPVISADGRFVAYESLATNLVPVGTTVSDVYQYDTVTKAVRRVSQVSETVGGDDDSNVPAISADGRWVAFQSRATNLVAFDINGVPDVFLHSECWATGESIGAGLAGTGGAIPALTLAGGPCFAKGYELKASNVVGGAAGLFLYGFGEKAQPAFGGVVQVDLAQPHAFAPLVFGGPAGSVGAGSLTVEVDLAVLAGLSFVLQALAADPAAPFGVSMSNAVRLDVGY